MSRHPVYSFKAACAFPARPCAEFI